MIAAAERRLLQCVIALACLVPIAAGGAGILHGPAMIRGAIAASADLDSHFRYLSGLLLGIGIGFACCVPAIERRTFPFRTLGAIVLVGGLGRLVSLIEIGPPGRDHLFGLVMELGTTPLLLLWQARIARLFA
jgi:hypothetical protein